LLQQDLKQVQQRQQLWEAIQKDPKQLDQLIQNPQLPAQEKVALQQMKQDSNSLNENIQEQLTQLQQIKTQLDQQEQTLKTEKQEAINDTKIKALIKNIRAFLRSILLAVGFVSIGWLGQRESR
jgi:ABC-type protease/lipase transport system fused ATPase/permease subunit